MTVQFQATQIFDQDKMRHYLNGAGSVLHCHHYSTLFTQLADDANWLSGPQLLAESAEESFYSVLTDYFGEYGITDTQERVGIAEQYYSHVGLGQVAIHANGETWTADMPHAHVDEGWIKKWGQRDKAVNFIGQGYLAAAAAAIQGAPCGTYRVVETQSIVKGADVSKFNISKK